MSGELDQMTLARARRGEAPAIASLVRHYHGRVFALVGRMLVGRATPAVEDVAQEALIRVCRGLGRFDPAGSARLSTWILTVTMRACLNAIRDGRRRETVADAGAPALAPDDPERTAADRELGRRVEAAMASLPEEMRAVLVLRAYHDFDYAEIAQALALEVGTVKSRLGRARAALRVAVGLDTEDGRRDDESA